MKYVAVLILLLEGCAVQTRIPVAYYPYSYGNPYSYTYPYGSEYITHHPRLGYIPPPPPPFLY